MSIDISRFLPADTKAAARAALTPISAEMHGSMILAIAGEVRALQAQGHEICNLTVGDFKPNQFRIPEALAERIQYEVAEGHTNYPPADGVPELKAAIADLYRRDLGLDYGPESVCVGSGARPPIFASWNLFVEPGDKTVSFLPMWNVGYYAHIFQSDHQFVATTSENNFFPAVDQVRESIRGARLMVTNSPLNPTGTAISEDVLRGIATALVEENRGRERPCMWIYDQVYWMLTFGETRHLNPVALVPECAPYVVQVDAISKCFAATGLRVGWGVLPSYLQPKMKALIGHMGSWAPRPEQLATAWFLSSPDRVDAAMKDMRQQVESRLGRLYEGIASMRERGLPVDAIAPQGAIYLSFRMDLKGRGFEDNEAIRKHLLHEAGIAVVPFQAFDLPDENGWFRMSIGAVGLDDIDGALERLESLVRAL
jgi:aspartate aminotransferase